MLALNGAVRGAKKDDRIVVGIWGYKGKNGVQVGEDLLYYSYLHDVMAIADPGVAIITFVETCHSGSCPEYWRQKNQKSSCPIHFFRRQQALILLTSFTKHSHQRQAIFGCLAYRSDDGTERAVG